jgi:hypothetical protein
MPVESRGKIYGDPKATFQCGFRQQVPVGWVRVEEPTG